MADFIRFMEGISKHLTGDFGLGYKNLEKHTIDGSKLEDIILNDEGIYKFWNDLGLDKQDTKNITLEISSKAKANYNIASINIKNSNQSLISGFYSIAKDKEGKVEKYHFSDRNKIYNGFKDDKTSKDFVSKNTIIKLTKEKAIEMFQKHQSFSVLSAIFKRTIQTLRGLLPKNVIKNPHLSQKDIDEINLMRENGLTAAEIASKKGVSVSTVRGHLPKKLKQGNKLSEEKIAQINELNNQGYTIQEISNITGVSLNSVRRHIVDTTRIRKIKTVITEEIKNEIQQKYLEGKTYQQISDETGLGRGTITRYIPKKNRVPNVSQDKINEIIEYAKQGMSARQIAKKCKVSSSFVNKHLPKELKQKHGTPQETIDKIRLLHKQGLSVKEIAKICKVREAIVYSYRTEKKLNTSSPMYKKINELRKSGMSIDDIAQECNVSRSTVYNFLEPDLKPGRGLSEDVIQGINESRKQGLSVEEICDKYNISHATLFNYLEDDIKFQNLVTEEQQAQINQLKRDGVPIAQIAKKFKISYSSVVNHLADDLKPEQRNVPKDELLNCLKERKGIYEISQELGFAPSTIWSTMRKYNLKSHKSVSNAYRATKIHPYKQFINEDLKKRFCDLYYIISDKETNSPALEDILGNIANELSKNEISFETRNELIPLIKLLDDAERNILSADEILKSKELSTMKKWADKAETVDYDKELWNNLINSELPGSGYGEIAQLLNKYTIKGIDDPNVSIIEKYSDIINSSRDKDGKISHASIKKILHLETYKNTTDKTLRQQAENFAKNPDGSIDEEKAGQYLSCLKGLEHPELLDSDDLRNFAGLIKSRYQTEENSQELAVKNLLKLEEYFEKSKGNYEMGDFCKTMDITTTNDNSTIANQIERNIAKKFFTEYYMKNDTGITVLDKRTKDPVFYFCKSAKEDIYKQKKFPGSLHYIIEFEEDMLHLASKDGETGIKFMKVDKGNPYLAEVKKRATSYRLLSLDGRHFTIFDQGGLH